MILWLFSLNLGVVVFDFAFWWVLDFVCLLVNICWVCFCLFVFWCFVWVDIGLLFFVSCDCLFRVFEFNLRWVMVWVGIRWKFGVFCVLIWCFCLWVLILLFSGVFSGVVGWDLALYYIVLVFVILMWFSGCACLCSCTLLVFCLWLLWLVFVYIYYVLLCWVILLIWCCVVRVLLLELIVLFVGFISLSLLVWLLICIWV